ncbi:MAG: serine hydrolase domain-containing protein [Verrucomicrobiota bacterium]
MRVDIELVCEAFEANFRERGELGASVAVWQEGEEVVSLGAGWCERERERVWKEETLVPVYSCTKGPAAVCFLMVLQEAGLSGEDWVGRVWPELGAGECGEISFVELLSHQAGLPALAEPVGVTERERVVELLEETVPFWEPGSRHGYHARSIGFVLDELSERLVGMRLGTFWEEKLRGPLDLEFWMGLPKELDERVATLYPGRYVIRKEEKAFYEAMKEGESLSARAFGSLRGFQSAKEMNEREAWRGGYPSFGGVGTARGLARFYQEVLGFGTGVIPEEVREILGKRVVDGDDQVFLGKTAFGAGMMLDPLDGEGRKLRRLFGPSEEAFGHPGAGGSHAFCDPETGISFAYVMNQMELGLFPGEKGLGLVAAVFSS